MGDFLLGLIGIAFSLTLIKYREKVGGMMGEANWMRKVGGIYNFIIIVATFLFFFSIAKITGTTNIFLSPLSFILPSVGGPNTGGY